VQEGLCRLGWLLEAHIAAERRRLLVLPELCRALTPQLAVLAEK